MQQWFTYTYMNNLRGRIFSHARSFYELVVSNLDRPMHGSLWVWVTHSTFIEGLHMTKNIKIQPQIAFWLVYSHPQLDILVSPEWLGQKIRKLLWMLATKS
jgi:hypothetical protein